MGHHNQVYNAPQQQQEQHKSSWTHELIAGAAAFEAMKAYENKRQADGNHDHTFAREMLAAVAAAEADKLIETKGLDFIDRERAKRQAVQQAHQLYDEKYGPGGQQGGGGGGGGYGGGQQMGGGQYGQQGGFQGQQGGGPGYGGGGGGYGGGGGGGEFENEVTHPHTLSLSLSHTHGGPIMLRCSPCSG